MMSHYTLDTSSRRHRASCSRPGRRVRLHFHSLTTMRLSRIPRHQLADASGLNSLLRQIGGSLGLAIFASCIPRFEDQRDGALAPPRPGRPEVASGRDDHVRYSPRGYDAESARSARLRCSAARQPAGDGRHVRRAVFARRSPFPPICLFCILEVTRSRPQKAAEVHAEI
jgi:hypothetical protein